MPIEAAYLRYDKPKFETCPKCNAEFEPFLRGMVQRFWSRKYILFGKREGYCAVICRACKDIVGWEE